MGTELDTPADRTKDDPPCMVGTLPPRLPGTLFTRPGRAIMMAVKQRMLLAYLREYHFHVF
jgi:hypothetical protein